MQKPNNILVTRPIGAIGMPRAGHVVAVRYNSMPITEEMSEGRTFHVWVEMLPDVWDANAINRLGRRGAFREVQNAEGVKEAIATLQAAWGPLPVQDNSGLTRL